MEKEFSKFISEVGRIEQKEEEIEDVCLFVAVYFLFDNYCF
jgi:hypothetical protein